MTNLALSIKMHMFCGSMDGDRAMQGDDCLRLLHRGDICCCNFGRHHIRAAYAGGTPSGVQGAMQEAIAGITSSVTI